MRNLLLAVLMLVATPAIAEDNLKLFSTDINVRTSLTFKVADTAVQKMLPAGWELNPPTAGPAKGFNLGVTLIDYVLVQDPEGKPLPPRNIVVLNIPAKKAGTSDAATMVFGGFIAQAGVPGAYGVYGPANITVDRRSHTGPDGKSMINETWQAKADDGSFLDLQIEFERGVPARSKVEAKFTLPQSPPSIASIASSRPPMWHAAPLPASIASANSLSKQAARSLVQFSMALNSLSASRRSRVIRGRYICQPCESGIPLAAKIFNQFLEVQMLSHVIQSKAYPACHASSLLNRNVTKNLFCAAIFAAALAPIQSATAQSYPSRPVTLVLPFAAGGPTDTLARILADRMRVTLGQPVIVENVTGAAGTISIGRVVRAAPDGYTLSMGPWNSHVLTGALYTLAFDLQKDLQPIALIANNPSVIVSKTAAPATDLKELIAWIKANPDKLSAGTSGVGAATHVAGVLLQQLTGTRFQFVPYRGAGPAVQDLVAGQIDLMIDQISNVLGQVRAGRIRGYAVTSKTRAMVAPELPTVDEAGLPNFHISVWHGLWAPKSTPKDVVAKLNRAVVDALADANVRARFADIGQEIYPLDQQTPNALAALQKAEIEKWWPIIKAAGIKAE